MKDRGEKWAMLTAYDMYTAATFDEAGIPVLLIGGDGGAGGAADPVRDSGDGAHRVHSAGRAQPRRLPGAESG
ncbi:3-methyl-2-oxobutanoate hydroxymethyltransferase [Streptomyces sp. ATexAB-D23]|uniref:3-methyl-2-oxobutanoate hydroxymethyltransferase n=1 Tax=unclassified Streptomyces TaxID=2593676 RepID=UPI002D21E8B2|nr:3-methyl-2-oxobutanoate hydroxymethyltransferase [Streptomyces sp. ATexAB-D23]